jgi:hypothetical protein
MITFFSLRNRLYFVSDAPKRKNALNYHNAQHATMAVIFQRAVRDEDKIDSSD